MTRAIVLGGGGPACGLQIGALRALAEHGFTFDIWSLSCIGAWVGIVYNQFDGTPQERVRKTYDWFRKVFVPDDVHSGFPTNRVFAPDLRGNMLSMIEFMTDPKVLRSMFVPKAMLAACQEAVGFATDRRRWTEGDANMLLLQMMSVNPLARLLTSAIYRTQANGISRMHYPDASFLKDINFERLKQADQPLIYHNAHNVTMGRMEYFTNHPTDFKTMNATTLCACSALPMVLKPIKIGEHIYCEGAMLRPLDFDPLEDHPDITEVWSLPILDTAQVHEPKDMTAAMGNLPMTAAAAHGHSLAAAYQREHPQVKFITIEPAVDITYDWTHSNYEVCCHAGYSAAQLAITQYLAAKA